MANEARSERLGDDILRYIFVLLAHDPARDETDWNWYAIAHVCRHWRTVALDTGAFWSNILCHSTSLDIINMQLSRSKNTDLSLTCIQYFYTIQPLRFDEILSAVFAHKERIVHMYIKAYDTLWSDFKEFICPFPSKLNTLHVEIYYKVDPPHHTQLEPLPVRNLLKLQNLRTLRIVNIALRLSTSLKLKKLQPLIHLTEISFNNVIFVWRHLPKILRLCPNIQKISIVSAPGQLEHAATAEDDQSDSGMPPTLLPSFHLASLCDLRLHGLSITHALTLFQNLVLPVSSNWDLRCPAPPFLNFQPNNDSLETHEIAIRSLFSRHTHCETLHVTLQTHAMQFRTESSLEMGEVRDDRTKATTEFILDHQLMDFTFTDDERCAFLTRFIRSSHWRNANTFQIHFQLGTGEISNDKWVDLLSSFDNLSSLDVLLPTRQSQTEFSASLKYTGEHDILTNLENLSFKLLYYDEGSIENIKSFLCDARHKHRKVSKIRIEYPNEARRHDAKNIQNLNESLSEYTQEVRVVMYRRMNSMYLESVIA